MTDGPVSSRIYDLARATLDAIVDGWPPEQPALPDRRYVHTGTPAADSEQFVVWVPRTIGMGTGANVGQQGIAAWPDGDPGMRTVIVTVQILRAVPHVDSEGTGIVLPSVEALEKSAKVLLADAQCVQNALIAAQDAGSLAGFGNLAFETWDAIDAAGGLAGSNLRVRLGAW